MNMQNRSVIIALCFSFVYARTYRDISMTTSNNSIPPNIRLPFNSSALSEAMIRSVELALSNCQAQLQWERWNCETTDFLAKRSTISYDRESAFVQTMIVAALIYTVSTKCESSVETCVSNSANDCLKRLGHSEKIVQSVLQNIGKSSTDLQTYAKTHNFRAAALAVRVSMRKQCRCHGLSGSCSLQTCWWSLSTFPEIAMKLKKMYDQAKMIALDNSGHFNRYIKDESLVFVNESRDYCKRNSVTNWPGTQGRKCSRSTHNQTSLAERKSCRKLCRDCGLNVRKRRIMLTKQCNCKFQWCCNVRCDTCTENIVEYYCDI